MRGYYLKEYPVPIPYGAGPVVVRNGKTVEFQMERDYTYGRKNTRVKRRVIGKINPEIRETMFPNEAYFELIPNNPVPVEIREGFLSECQRKRENGSGGKASERGGGSIQGQDDQRCAG